MVRLRGRTINARARAGSALVHAQFAAHHGPRAKVTGEAIISLVDGAVKSSTLVIIPVDHERVVRRAHRRHERLLRLEAALDARLR